MGVRGDGFLDPGGERVGPVEHHAQREGVMFGEVPGERLAQDAHFGAHAFPGTKGAGAVTGHVCAVSRLVGHRDPGLQRCRSCGVPGFPPAARVGGVWLGLGCACLRFAYLFWCIAVLVAGWAEDGVGRWLVSGGRRGEWQVPG